MPARPGEDELIARYFAPLAGPAGLGLADDAALVAPPAGWELVLTTDALVAGVHFFADDPAGAIARKALRVNLSDLAAKGAEPIGFLIALALPGDWTASWLEAFAAGLGEDAALYRCPLIGGDTVKTPGPLTIAITALGAVETGRMAKRSGVRPGDRLYVTGTIGDAALGLRLRLGQGPELAEAHRRHLLDRYLQPEPRLAVAPAMARFANAGMDVSDGFVGDLTKMLRVSGVSARVELQRLPLSPAARAAIVADPALFDVAATGGDDYELLAAVAPETCAAFEAAGAAAGVAVTLVGEAFAGAGPPRFIGRDGGEATFPRGAFSHFSSLGLNKEFNSDCRFARPRHPLSRRLRARAHGRRNRQATL
ncbi:MAG: thiamine-phosphate kinase [Roseiarcus sp.]|jgi:thiamine-monophosphate kinase